MNKKGQAAVTDALYFLMIITGLCILLFSYASSYGKSVDSILLKKYNSDFSTDALKSVLYSSTPRDPAENIYDSDVEIDHLLAYLKEDYFENTGFSDETKLVLYNSISDVLAPKLGSFDYLFTFTVPSNDEYIYVLLHLSSYHTVEYVENNRLLDKVVLDTPAKVDLFCNANGIAVDPGKVKDLIAKLGSTVQSSAVVLLTKKVGTTPEGIKVQVDLIMWPPSLLTDSSDGNVPWYTRNWDCVDVSTFIPASTP